jgi:hypothetical protein
LSSRSQNTNSTGNRTVASSTRGQVAASLDAIESDSDNEDEVDVDEVPPDIIEGERGCLDDHIS